MTFPSQQPINMSPTKMLSPFSGAKDPGVEFPKLSDFLKITQLPSYAGKLKKLKCVETEDLLNLAFRVGFLHVEEQRVRRYLDHFNQKTLIHAEMKPQPITLDNFFKLSNLTHIIKGVRKFGVVEFDDLRWIAYSDLATLITKKVEMQRFKRYCDKVNDTPDIRVLEIEVLKMTENLNTFIVDAQLKSFKSNFEKLGVVETDDLTFVLRSDLPKMKQVEYERFGRYREKYTNTSQARRHSSTQQPNSTTSIQQPVRSLTSSTQPVNRGHVGQNSTNFTPQNPVISHQKRSDPLVQEINNLSLGQQKQQQQQAKSQMQPLQLQQPKSPPSSYSNQFSPPLPYPPDHRLYQQGTANASNNRTPPRVRRKTWQHLPHPNEDLFKIHNSGSFDSSRPNLTHQNTYPSPKAAYNSSHRLSHTQNVSTMPSAPRF